MKERPILFSGPMVRAILEGRKTQTRRIVNPEPWKQAIAGEWGLCWSPQGPLHRFISKGFTWAAKDGDFREMLSARCPYGRPGDRLWVRETWMPFGWSAGRVAVGYKASNDIRPDGVGPVEFGSQRWFNADQEREDLWRQDIAQMDVTGDRWRPSILMPRWASRINLEVVEVRVERLQDISEADARAEGVEPYAPDDGRYREGFVELWESINGPGSHAENPWVWVIEFRRVEK